MVNSVTPNRAENTGVVGLNVKGAGFVGGAEVKLARDGFSDIGATNESVVTDELITCDVDLTGVAPGSWDLVVTFPDASTYELPNGFYIGGAYVSAWGDELLSPGRQRTDRYRLRGGGRGRDHSLGLKADGSIVAWGRNSDGQCTVPEPNSGFVAVAAGWYHSLGLRSDGSVAAWGDNNHGQCNVPEPNSGFVAVSAGWLSQPGPQGGRLHRRLGKQRLRPVQRARAQHRLRGRGGGGTSTAWASRRTAPSWPGGATTTASATSPPPTPASWRWRRDGGTAWA